MRGSRNRPGPPPSRQQRASDRTRARARELSPLRLQQNPPARRLAVAAILAKSRYVPGPPPRSQTRTDVRDKDGMRGIHPPAALTTGGKR